MIDRDSYAFPNAMSRGLTVIDYFAAQAMAALVPFTSGDTEEAARQKLAKQAYLVANAMYEERKKYQLPD